MLYLEPNGCLEDLLEQSCDGGFDGSAWSPKQAIGGSGVLPLGKLIICLPRIAPRRKM